MIRSLNVFVPKNLVSREGIEPSKLADFERVVGIKKTRRWTKTASEFIKSSVELSRSKIDIADVKSVFVVTQSPDRLSPCMAASVHGILGLPAHVPAFDINQSCTGFIYGMWLANRIGRSIGVFMDMLRFEPTPLESLIFSDACVVAEFSPSQVPTDFIIDPLAIDKLYAKPNGEMVMDGGAVFDLVTSKVPRAIKSFESLIGPSDFLAQHQPNLSMMKLVEKRVGYDGRSLHSIENYGNQSMCSVATAIAANEEKILGKRVLMCAYGAGFSCAVTATKWSEFPVSTITEIE